MNLGLAIQIAAEVHNDQQDKAGEDYILHCLAIMDMVKDRVPADQRKAAMVVTVLHDTLEDFEGTEMERQLLHHRIKDRFGYNIYGALVALSHVAGEPYSEYIERIAENWLARVVKICDLTHNMDPRRIPATQIVDKDFQRWDKYRKALIRLERA